MAEIKYDIIQKIAVLSQRPRGWERQLNLISWNRSEEHTSELQSL